MNNYKGVHFMKLLAAKKRYKELMQDQILQLPKMDCISVTYKVFPATARKGDLMNVVSIHSKFFLDALQEFNIIPDDNWFIVPEEITAFGGIDRINPRVEIIIKEITNANNFTTI